MFAAFQSLDFEKRLLLTKHAWSVKENFFSIKSLISMNKKLCISVSCGTNVHVDNFILYFTLAKIPSLTYCRTAIKVVAQV